MAGSGIAALQSGPAPAAMTLAPAASDSFVWTYDASSPGGVTFRAGASGTGVVSGLLRRAVEVSSNAHDILIPVADAALVPVQSMPLEVSRGQTGVVPLSLTFTNLGGTGASTARASSFARASEAVSPPTLTPSMLTPAAIRSADPANTNPSTTPPTTATTASTTRR
jgi:hypothetical protein